MFIITTIEDNEMVISETHFILMKTILKQFEHLIVLIV